MLACVAGSDREDVLVLLSATWADNVVVGLGLHEAAGCGIHGNVAPGRPLRLL